MEVGERQETHVFGIVPRFFRIAPDFGHTTVFVEPRTPGEEGAVGETYDGKPPDAEHFFKHVLHLFDRLHRAGKNNVFVLTVVKRFQALVDVFLYDVQSPRDALLNTPLAQFNAHKPAFVTALTQTFQQVAVSATQVQNAGVLGDQLQDRLEVKTSIVGPAETVLDQAGIAGFVRCFVHIQNDIYVFLAFFHAFLRKVQIVQEVLHQPAVGTEL